MMSGIIKKLYLLAGRKNICLVSLFATVLFAMILWKIDVETGGDIGASIGLQLAFTRSTFELLLLSWKSGGVSLLMDTIWINFIYAVSYALLLSSVPAYFARQRSGFDADAIPVKELVFFLVPAAAGACDWIVQVMLILIFGARALSGPMIAALSVAGAAKWILIVLSLVLVLRSYFSARKARPGTAGMVT
jgi:hypothetical protein